MVDLARELESLRRENARLRKLLKLTDAEVAPTAGTQGAWFERAPGPVDSSSSPQSKVAFYAALFRARTDVYAITWENARSGTSGWVPAVEGGWRKGATPETRRYLPLTAFTYGELDTGVFAKLEPCSACQPPRRKAQIDQENAARGGTVPEATAAPETTAEPDTPENTALPSDGEEDVEITLVFHD